MKNKSVFIVGLVAMASLALVTRPAMADMADKAVGNWKTPKGSVIRMSKSADRLVGTIVSVRDKSRRDSKNPDAGLRSRKLPGIRILALKKKGADSWSGSLYNTEDGKTYSGTLKVLDANRIKLSGCVLAVLCKSQIWTRK